MSLKQILNHQTTLPSKLKPKKYITIVSNIKSEVKLLKDSFLIIQKV